MHSMDIVRGSFDFIVVTDVPSFDDFAAIKLVVEASGAVENLTCINYGTTSSPYLEVNSRNINY